MVPVDSNQLIKRSLNGKYSLSVNVEMTSNVNEAAENTIFTDSGSVKHDTNVKNELRKSEQLHELN